jgi:CO/xanthine dehydrogenase Mo-binding subunit
MRILLDGGAYASSSTAVTSNAASFACGPYRVDNALIESTCVYTNNPPCGAMRGFGAVQTCFAAEAQMDKLAAALEIDPVELRLLNALAPGDVLPTGQRLTGSMPVAEVIRRPPRSSRRRPRSCRAIRCGCPAAPATRRAARESGAASASRSASRTSRTRRASTTRPPRASCSRPTARRGPLRGDRGRAGRLERDPAGRADRARHRRRRLAPHSTAGVGSAGSASASRLTWMVAGAVRDACRAALEQRERTGGEVDVERVYRHPRTTPLDPEDGQITGERAHVALATCAMKVVAEVDVELGLTRVVWIGAAQDIGKAVNPQAVEGQIEGGTAQGLGLALMEEIQTRDGLITNASFTDYLIPTALDMPPVESVLIEDPEPDAPYGVKGVGEPPTVVSTAAIVSALRAATGRPLTRVPVRPDDIVTTSEHPPRAESPPAAPA